MSSLPPLGLWRNFVLTHVLTPILLELISEGNLGLLKAVERFDPAEGTPFSAFSTWWIKQSIKRALSRSYLKLRN